MEINDQVKERLIKYFDGLEDMAKKGVDVASDQLPLVVHEIIAWNRAATTIPLVLFTAILVFSVYKLRTSLKEGFAYAEIHKCRGDWPAEYVLASLGSAVGAIISTIGCLINGMPCAKAWFAPRLIILETLRDLVHPSSN